MKDPKVLFPFLFASSWLGDLLLTILAFFLAFTSEGPLTPLIFMTVALCILAGNLLPIGTYFLFIRWRESELKAEAAQANLRVRDALKRSEEVIGRLDEAEGALSKAILVARQLPERITTSFRSLEELTEKINTLEVASFTEALKGSSESIDALKTESESIHKQVEEVKKELAAVPKTLTKVIQDAMPDPKMDSPDEADVSLGERLDLVYESLETVQDSLDGLLNRMASLSVASPKPAPLDEENEPADDADLQKEGEETVYLVEDEDLEDDSSDLQEEMILPQEPESGEEKPEVEPHSARLSVRAMVGINNKLYIRGDEPWLSWDLGRPMDLIGIGEFAYSVNDLKEPIEVSVFLNDDFESDAGRIVLEPGKVLRINPIFPK